MFKHKNKISRFKASLIFTVVAALLTSFILSSASIMHGASAYGTGDPPKEGMDSARAKLIALSLDFCFGEAVDRGIYKSSGRNVVHDSAKTGIDLMWDDDYYKGYYAEYYVDSKGTDSKWSCADFGKKLGLLSAVGVDYMKDLLCDYKNPDNYGMLKPKSSGDMKCQDYLNEIIAGKSTGYYYTIGEKWDYFDELFREKVFGGSVNVPGNDLYTFTDLEKYYMYLDAFKSRCATSRNGGTVADGSSCSNGIGVPETNAEGGIEIRCYSVSDKNRTIYFYTDRYRESGYQATAGGITCEQVADSSLSLNGEAVVNGLAKELSEKCQETYTEAVNKAKEYWNEHKSEYPEAQSAVDQFFASYSANATPYNYNSSVPSFTCKTNDFINQWNTLKDQFGFTDAPELEGYTGEAESTSDSSSAQATEYTCSNSGGAISLGWIVCPVMEWAANASEGIYKDYVEPSLRIEPKLFNTNASDTTSNAHAAWTTFRDIANVIFVIFLLFIIISQVTGFGIDNYGIKKSLPKLVVAAILVNISYYICMGAIDLSNILGNSIQNIFSALPTGDPATIEGIDMSAAAGSTVISAVAIGVALFVGLRALWANPAIVLTLLIALLGLIISIFFLFVLLVAREAMIVVLTVLSPIAFVCYMLPNTKNTFDKWLKALKALLLVYPVCGLLVGGGNWLSRLLLSVGYGNGGVIKAFTAMLIGILPIFFIPSVLKSSMSVMGTVGAKLSGLSKATNGWAKGKVKKSAGYQTSQRAGLQRKMRYKAGINADGSLKHMGRVRQAVFHGGHDNRARAAIAYNKMRAEEGSLNAALGEDYMLETETANVAKEITSTGEINNLGYDDRTGTISGGLAQQLQNALESGDRARIRAYTDAMAAKGEVGHNATRAAYNAAIRSGRVSAVAAKTMADNVLNKHSSAYKADNREFFNVMQGINSQATPAAIASRTITTDAYLGQVDADGISNRLRTAMSATSTTLSNMDDSTFGAVFGGYDTGGTTNGALDITGGAGSRLQFAATANEITQYMAQHAGATHTEAQAAVIDGKRRALGAQAYAALHDQNANLKADRRALLEQMVQQSGYTPEVRHVEVDNTVETHDQVQDSNIHGRNTTYRRYGQRGTYYDAPRGWTYDAAASAPGRPVFTNPNDPNHHYDASTNKYF